MSRARGEGHYKIVWDREKRNFHFDTDDGLHFYGWWRYTKILKTDTIVHAVDLYVKREHEDPAKYVDVCCESMVYEEDPRDNLQSLNADICAAANKWFFQNFEGNAKALDQLIKQAMYPTIHVNQIATLDQIIARLKELRSTSIISGGTRICELAGDRQSRPLLISINVTDQAIALEGKVPTAIQSAMLSGAIKAGRGGDVRAATTLPKANPENVKSLVDQLKKCHDKGTARKIRAMLRQMGHKGGARSLNV